MDIDFTHYRRVGTYRHFEPWIGALRGADGVYIIRALDGTILYNGESHTARLYETLTRHFQDVRHEA